MNNSSQLNLPFSELFSRLRQAGFPLGICDYNLLVEALQTDIYDPLEPELLKLLLQTIWVKTSSQKQQFEEIFRQVVPQDSVSTFQPSQSPKSETSKSNKNRHHSLPHPLPRPKNRQENISFFPPLPSWVLLLQ
ncbi:MAG: hypothetical protein HC941_26900 [Microcoleus sp. SU_5_3]|nr:hypothetical protein [Microcoleus sp. SU_5_3]